MNKTKIIAVVGTNASGKSALGIELAQRFDGEIISADSRQVFEGFDLCCGKVTAEERALVPHHMLDVRRIGEAFSVSDFQEMSYRLIPEIAGRGHVPFIVGGTGLYVAAVVRDYELMQGEPDMALRAELDEKTLDELYPLLPDSERERLRQNPSDWRNKRRIIRCIEKSRQPTPAAKASAPRFDALQLGLTWPMEIMEQRIWKRLEQRLAEGMLDEVRDYLAAGAEAQHLHDLGLEYRYILRYLSGEFRSEAAFKDELARAIRQFTKRQITWFKRDESIHWLDIHGDYRSEAEALVEKFLNK
ncbi:MAG: tRNA (adenosine(37)-N6)-dimethylallyltransferase MiaA [Oscillospiraceae bacterium]|nr:tRNA (adenosine(37)-N6)-dimethylallyltransferase MiaA [Oscillospiraceae bacterium]